MPDVKPLLLIDVDGPLIPDLDLRHKARHVTDGWVFDAIVHEGSTFKLWHNARHGRMLTALADVYELTWATSWGELANVHVGPRLGLPRLPVLALDVTRSASTPVLSWKTDQVAALVGSRAFAWIDDEVNRHDRRRLAADARVGAHLLRRIPSHIGLTDADIVALRDWAGRLRAG